jgi:hypothetical protein
LSEKLRNFENNLKEMRGFYVTKMKKDKATGHYFGVATWIPRNAPLPGARTSHNNRWSVTRETSTPATSVSAIPETFGSRSRGEDQQSERQYRGATSDDFSRLATQEKKQTTDTVQRKSSSFYDPYDSYEL